MFVGKAGAYLSEAFSGAPLYGRFLAPPTNIKLSWRGLPGTNTSLLRKSVNYGRKKFYSRGPWSKRWLALFSLWQFLISCSRHPRSYSTPRPGNTNWKGRLSTVDLLINVAFFVTQVNIFFCLKINWSKRVSVRRSSVLILPLQQGFPAKAIGMPSMEYLIKIL